MKSKIGVEITSNNPLFDAILTPKNGCSPLNTGVTSY